MNRTRQRFRLRMWHVPTAILMVLLLGVIGWLLPRRVSEVVSVDGRQRYSAADAPPRRDIIWQPAENLPAAPRDIGPADSIVRPQLADGGVSLYYTVQRVDGSADIYRSQYDGRAWLPGKAVAELNSAADDFGPVISADGEELYLYSDRPGGHGGFDIYIARRTPEGWSTPENIGPQLNTPAHEYDPAIAPDGREFYFSSNRTSQMQQRLEAAQDKGEDPANIAWKATLRAQPGLPHFDLYVAHRGIGKSTWEEIRPLGLANTPTANEGEPYVSPDGAFLYFASDRMNEHGGPANYDLYRARRVPGGVASVENLGSGVNTAANEHDPALSAEGFRIVFSSDRRDQADAGGQRDVAQIERYALYQSVATEVYDQTGWDTSHVPPLGTLLWWLVTALLVLALLAALVWYLREVSMRRAPVPVFLLLALLIHLLLAGGAFLVPIDGMTLAERITKHLETIVARDAQLESAHQSHQTGEKSYEKVADLKSVESVKISDAPRQTTVAPNMPVPTPSPAPSVPRQMNRQSLPERVALVSPKATPIQQSDPQLNRRDRIVENLLTEDLVKIDPVEPRPTAPAENALAKADVQVDRTQTQTPTTNPLVRRPVNMEAALSRESLDAQRPDVPSSSPPSQPAAQPIERVARADVAMLDSLKILTENNTASQSDAGDPAQPQSVKPTVNRNSPAAESPAPAPPQMQVAQGYSTPLRPTTANALQPIELRAPSLTNAAAESTVPRLNHVALLDSATPERIAINPADAVEETADSGAAESRRGEKVDAGRLSDAASPPVRALDGLAGGSSKSAADRFESATALRAEFVVEPSGGGSEQPRVDIARADTTAFGDGGVADEKISVEAPGGAGDVAGDSSAAIDGIEVDVARTDGETQLSVEVPVPSVFGGRYDQRRSDLAIGSLAKVDFDADVSFSPIATRIERLPADAPLVLFAQDRIGLQAMLRLRVGDDDTKQDLIDSFGGKKETLVAIERGLAWLAGVQHEDGHWDLQNFATPKGGQRSSGHGNAKSDTAATGLGLLPFLGDGHTHQGGQYQPVVEKGLRWLVEHQKEDGDLFTGGEGNAHMYSHGIAAIAICEAYGMTKDEALREPAQRAIDFVVKAQHNEGGWRYRPGEKGDTSVVGWQVMALKSGQMAGLAVPEETLNKARRYINDARRGGNDSAQYAYQPGGGGEPAMTAEGLLCYAYLGAKRDDPNLLRTVDWIAERVPEKGKDTSYYWYYGTQVLFHVQGEPWKKWNDAMSSTVLSTQEDNGPHAGSWDPKDNWEQRGGRIMSTSLRLLMLEVYFRHLPLYQALE